MTFEEFVELGKYIGVLLSLRWRYACREQNVFRVFTKAIQQRACLSLLAFFVES